MMRAVVPVMLADGLGAGVEVFGSVFQPHPVLDAPGDCGVLQDVWRDPLDTGPISRAVDAGLDAGDRLAAKHHDMRAALSRPAAKMPGQLAGDANAATALVGLYLSFGLEPDPAFGQVNARPGQFQILRTPFCRSRSTAE